MAIQPVVVFSPASSEGKEVYAAIMTVSCNSPAPKPQITCTFRNRCDKKTSATTDINIISGMLIFWFKYCQK